VIATCPWVGMRISNLTQTKKWNGRPALKLKAARQYSTSNLLSAQLTASLTLKNDQSVIRCTNQEARIGLQSKKQDKNIIGVLINSVGVWPWNSTPKSESRTSSSTTKQEAKLQQEMWMMIGHWLSQVIEIRWCSNVEVHTNRFPNPFLAFNLHANEILALTLTKLALRSTQVLETCYDTDIASRLASLYWYSEASKPNWIHSQWIIV